MQSEKSSKSEPDKSNPTEDPKNTLHHNHRRIIQYSVQAYIFYFEYFASSMPREGTYTRPGTLAFNRSTTSGGTSAVTSPPN